ncbi:hypothetical protein Hanom_Chr10g00920391 [Helianthus anomalus]
MFDTMWSFLAVQQRQLLFFCARLGLEPPPPLPARPPPPPPPKLIPTRTTFSTPKTIPVPKLPPKPTPSPEPYVQPPALTLSQNPFPPLLGSNNLAHAIDKSISLEVTKESNFGLDVEDLAEVLDVNVNNRWNFTNESSMVCYKSLEEKKTHVPLIKEDKDLVNGATRRRECRPPWRAVDTAPNANGRFEWRPPWKICFVLEDNNVLKRWAMIRAKCSQPTHTPLYPQSLNVAMHHHLMQLLFVLC